MTAQAPCSIKEGEHFRSSTSSAPPVTLSHKREGDSVRRSRKRRTKLGNDATAHLSGIPDCLAEDLDVLFCGINPGHMSAVTGHHYANPTNHFWHCLHLSGFTPRLLLPSEDVTLPARFNLGLINLVDRPSTSQADLSAQEMASSVPALLTKIARFRPRVACFIGKGIWLHVERALNHHLLKSDAAGDQNAGITLGAHAEGIVLEPAKTPATATLKDERSVYFLVDGDTPVIERPPKTELEGCCGGVKLEESEQNATTRRRSGISSSRKDKAPAFAYGLQPFKAVHDMVPHSSSVGETLFCVFPSTSGRVVSHQRDDKLALFEALRESLEHIKAGTLDTGSMRIIHLQADGR